MSRLGAFAVFRWPDDNGAEGPSTGGGGGGGGGGPILLERESKEPSPSRKRTDAAVCWKNRGKGRRVGIENKEQVVCRRQLFFAHSIAYAKWRRYRRHTLINTTHLR